ncbi:MAG: uridine kinase [Oscillospiraceae bacterium]|nr:uridine kinase [Oscillospiraceae bacterium]
MQQLDDAEIVLQWLGAHHAPSPAVIAIDGRCAAGKTTLARRLGVALSCGVVHMDDFFLRPEQRTAQRLAEPGGNVDYERFLNTVLEPLSRGESFSYQPYDCHSGMFQAPVFVKPSPMTIVEGSYSCHPALWEHYHCRVFLTIDRAEQHRRIGQRNGSEGLQMFLEKWIPLEERYFASLAERCMDGTLWIDGAGHSITKEDFLSDR